MIRFETRLIENLLRIERELKHLETYNIKYYSFEVMEQKKRVIHATPYEYRIVIAYLSERILNPKFESVLYVANMACRIGKGVHKAQRMMTHHLTSAYWKRRTNQFYCLKCDIKAYFDNIDHGILKTLVRKVINESIELEFIDTIIDSYGDGKGLPLGNQTLQWFGLLYLHPVDAFLEKNDFKWVRYMDDFCIIHEDKSVLVQLIVSINDYCIIHIQLL